MIGSKVATGLNISLCGRDSVNNEDGTRPALFQNCCVVLCIVCFISFYILFVCKCVLTSGDNPIAVNKYIISYQEIQELRYFVDMCWPVSRRSG